MRNYPSRYDTVDNWFSNNYQYSPDSVEIDRIAGLIRIRASRTPEDYSTIDTAIPFHQITSVQMRPTVALERVEWDVNKANLHTTSVIIALLNGDEHCVTFMDVGADAAAFYSLVEGLLHYSGRR